MSFLQIELRAESEAYPAVTDVASFLYDVSYAYELSRLAADPEHGNYVFSEESQSRDNRPISSDQQLHVVKLRQESPMLLMAAVMATPAAVASIWGLVQIIDKVANWPLNRRIAELQEQKLSKELRSMEPSQETIAFDLRKTMQARGEGGFLFDDVLERLERSRIRITDFDFQIVKQLPVRHKQQRDPALR